MQCRRIACMCTWVWAGVHVCFYCESVLKMTEQRSPKETKTPIAITAEESSGTQAFSGTVRYSFSFSSLWLPPPISLTQEKSRHSLSTSRSLIYDYQAGSCRSETIAHQTWLPVPMEQWETDEVWGTEHGHWLLLLRVCLVYQYGHTHMPAWGKILTCNFE